MSRPDLACIILGAGQGKRMKSALPKVMHRLAGRPMIGWLIETVEALGADKIITVSAPGMDDLRAAVAPHASAVQPIARGTGDAVRCALDVLGDFNGDVMILLGDMPLIRRETLQALRDARGDAGLSVLGVEFDPPPAFGRLVMRNDGTLDRIVEDKDCTEAERQITLCNSGAFCVDGRFLRQWVDRIGCDNAQNEFYITDLPAIAAQDGRATHVHVAIDADEVRGVNSRADLSVLEAVVQDRLRRHAMDGGATLIDPATTYFSFDTILGRDVVIEPNVFFGPGVTIGDQVTIHAFSHLERARVRDRASIGPFARLRPDADIGEGSKIGNFVEVKNATLGAGVKAGHLAYIGDADVGADVNFSCGAITVNYDGFSKKSKTVIGDNAMIGSNVNLVAPVTIGAGAYIAAGTTVAKDVPGDALAVAREKLKVVENWVRQKRLKQQ